MFLLLSNTWSSSLPLQLIRHDLLDVDLIQRLQLDLLLRFLLQDAFGSSAEGLKRICLLLSHGLEPRMIQGLLQSDSSLWVWLQELSDQVFGLWADSPPHSFTEVVFSAGGTKEGILHTVIGERQSAAESMLGC